MFLTTILQGTRQPAGSRHRSPFRWRPYGLLLGFAASLSYGPLLLEHGGHLWHSEHFRFFPALILATGCLVVGCVRESLRSDPNCLNPERWRMEPLAFCFSLLLLPVAACLNSPWLAACSFLCLGDSLLNRFRAARRFWRVLFVLIPLPLGYDYRLLHEMQNVSSAFASRMLDIMGVFHSTEGNVLDLEGRQFFVAEACTGLTSLYLFMAGTWLTTAFLQLRAIRAVPLIVSSVWWSVVANIVRIVVIAFAHDRWRLNLSTGPAHEITGLVVMGIAFLQILMTKQVIDFLFDPVVLERGSLDVDLRQRLTPAIVWNLITDPDLRSVNRTCDLPLGMEVHFSTLLRFLILTLLMSGTVYIIFAKSNLIPAVLRVVWRSA